MYVQINIDANREIIYFILSSPFLPYEDKITQRLAAIRILKDYSNRALFFLCSFSVSKFNVNVRLCFLNDAKGSRKK